MPLLFAISARGIRFRNNKVVFDDSYAPMHDEQPYVLRHCEDVELQPLSREGSAPGIEGAPLKP